MKKTIIIAISLFLIILTLYLLKEEKNIEIEIIAPVDDRAELIDNYYKARNMPLAGYGSKMVEVADIHGLDWRLLPAISIRETSGGKHLCKNPKAPNNPFGWGSCRIGFSSIDKAIETVGFKLENLSIYQGKTTKQKLYHYNGTVVPTYPNEVLVIMDKIKTL